MPPTSVRSPLSCERAGTRWTGAGSRTAGTAGRRSRRRPKQLPLRPPHLEEIPSSAEAEPEQGPKDSGTISAGELLLALGRLPDDALIFVEGQPFGGIRYTIETTPDGWRETIDLIGGPAHE